MTPTYDDAIKALKVVSAFDKTHPKTLRIFDTNLLTDVGNAKAFVEKYGLNIRYVSAWKAWLYWNGKIWERLDEDKQGYPQLLKEYAKDIANSYRIAADTIPNPSMAEDYRKHAKHSESNAKIKAMIDLITGERGIMKSYKDFDNKPHLFSCQNGTLNLLTQELQEPSPEDYLTKISPVIYDKNATCELWIKFLNRIMVKHPELIDYLQNLAGQCLYGEIREKAFWIFWGAGGDNGKTTFIETIQSILNEYGQTVPIAALLRENKSNIPTDLHSLMGSRMAYASEPDIGDELTSGMIKRITGKDTMKTRTLHEKPSQWKAQFKLIIATNNQPKISDPSDAMWSRVKCIPFLERIPLEEQDKQLGDKLKLESSGILNWMLEGCARWLQFGMKEPDIIKLIVGDYRENSDRLANWIEYCFEKNINGFVPFKIYYNLYILWCANHKIRPVQENTLPGMLRDRGYQIDRGWYINSKGEYVRDRGVFGLYLKSWLSGINNKCVTEIKDGKLVDRLTGYSVVSPVHTILETMDSDFDFACGLFGQVDRLSRVESILFVSHVGYATPSSSLSTTATDSVFLNSESVQSVQSVHNNNINKIITILKENYDRFTLHNLLDVYKNLEEVKLVMERKILTEFPEDLTNINLIELINNYCISREFEKIPQIERIKTIRDIIIKLQAESKSSVELKEIIIKAQEAGLDKETVESILSHLKTAGDIIEVSENRFRSV